MRRSALIAALLLAPIMVQAAPSEELAKTQAAIKASKANQEKLAKQQAEVESDLQDLQEKLVKAASAMQKSDAQLADTERRLAALSKQLEEKQGTLASMQKKLDGLSRIAIRLSRTPPQAMVLMPEDGRNRIEAAHALTLITSEIKTQSAAISKELDALAALKEKVESEKADAEKLRANNREQKKTFEASLKARKVLRDKIAASRAEEDTKIAGLAKKAKSLEDLIGKLNQEARREKPSKSSGKQVVSGEGVEGTHGNMRSFKDAKGHIRIPASGKVVGGFNDSDGSKGIKIATADGATVVAPFDAEVAYSGTFLNYGKLVILKHRGDYHTLLAGLGRIDVKAGDFLLEGEPIGAMGEGNERLYVELREHNQPVDPENWMRGL